MPQDQINTTTTSDGTEVSVRIFVPNTSKTTSQSNEIGMFDKLVALTISAALAFVLIGLMGDRNAPIINNTINNSIGN